MGFESYTPKRSSEIRGSVRSKYRKVAKRPEGHFPYPIGRESALNLGYNPSWLEEVPDEVVARFVGVGNPFSIRTPKLGEWVLDAGCGCGLDTFVSAILVGHEGWVSGVDLSAEMLKWPRAVSLKLSKQRVEFREASIEDLPYEDRIFHLAISNGVLNLVPNKRAAFSELARILKPGGILAVADLMVTEKIPPEVLAAEDAWST